MNLTYTGAHAATTARRHGNGSAEPHLEWTLELGTTAGAGDKNGLNVLRGVRMQGWVGLVASAGAGSGPGTEDALEWGLRSAQGSSAFAVRAVDLGFAFVGVHGIGDAYTYTSASKTWCPIGTGCQEWNIRTVDGTVSRPSGARAGADTTPHRTTRVLSASPYPPDPVPWAHAALVRPGRSQHPPPSLGRYSGRRVPDQRLKGPRSHRRSSRFLFRNGGRGRGPISPRVL